MIILIQDLLLRSLIRILTYRPRIPKLSYNLGLQLYRKFKRNLQMVLQRKKLYQNWDKDHSILQVKEIFHH
jgi:hypothetical protein